jgi:FkbM family methyltransferase
MKSNEIEIRQWFSDRGDYTHNITYDLTEDSVIIDLGGYTGVWVEQMINKYNSNVYIIEPIEEFYDIIVDKFKNNDKVNVLKVGISNEDKDGVIYLHGDATSANLSKGTPVSVKFYKMKTLLDKWNLKSVDLIQINIEGDEYELLEDMLKTGIINTFKNIQVQFHYGIDDDIKRRENIHNGLKSNGYKIKFNYPFVWESWYKNN